MQRWLILGVLVACSGKTTPSPTGGSGSGSTAVGPARSCAELEPRVRELYRADAQAREPKRVDDAVSDNTTMVMNDCAKAPDKVVACVNGIATVAELEARCLQPLDDEGTEARDLRR